MPFTIELISLISSTLNGTLLNFSKRYKDELRADFKREFGRNIYLPNGQSNNGNAARAAFSKPEVFARITHMPESLILGIKTAIEAVDSPFKGQLFSNS